MMGTTRWARIPLLPVKQENQNPTWAAQEAIFLKTIPMPVFTSLMERNSSKIAALFSLFLHYQHLHFSDWSTQLQLQHDEPGDDRSYQLLYSFYM